MVVIDNCTFLWEHVLKREFIEICVIRFVRLLVLIVCQIYLQYLISNCTEVVLVLPGLYNTFFFLKFLADTCPFWGHWYPCFGFLVMSPLGFKARVGSALFAIFAEANVMYIPQDSPLVLHLPTSWWPARRLTDSNVQPHEQKTHALPLCQRPGWII